ncbi:MAG: Flp pilus assembly protein CpaB [Henriciella sp.]|uniref:Flp pilus assembly protein CpaB n=1 Tax=Henriciella sp. TaxID=1968823 RepID=UPI003C74088B
MQMNPVLTLGLSITCGAAALLGARLFLSPDDKAGAPAELTVMEVEMQDVLVAARNIPRGVRLEEEWFDLESRPAEEVPLGAFNSFKEFNERSNGRPTLIELTAGEMLSEKFLLSEGLRGSLASKIPPGYRAYSVKMTDESGVAGFVLPGDHVDVIFYQRGKEGRLYSDQTASSSAVAGPVADVLLQNVEVLGVDLNDDMTAASPSPFSTATLAVSLEQAQRLSVASELGELSLALRGSADEEFQEATSISLGKDARPAPVARIAPRRLVAKAPTVSTVEVILGNETSSHSVPSSQ